jgi:hypothetical protein
MSTSGPRCPNHRVPLTRTNERNIGICPISGCRFEFKADDKEHSAKITPLDGVGG